MAKGILSLCIVLSVMAMILVGCGSPAAQPTVSKPSAVPNATSVSTPVIELKFTHHNPPTSFAQMQWIAPWCKKVEEATKGRVKITIYPARTLADEKQTVQAIESGVADIGWIVVGNFTGRFPLTEVTSLPFVSLAEGKVNGQRYSGGKVTSRILWELYEKFPAMQKEWSSMKMLYIASDSPSFIATGNKPVHNLNDLKGLKIRSLGRQAELLAALGASPVPMQIPEVYDAALKGVLDGMVANFTQIGSNRLYEVFHYYTPMALTSNANVVTMNVNTWNSLPKDIQNAISSVSGLYGSEFAGDAAWGFDADQYPVDMAKKGNYKFESVMLDQGEWPKWVALAGKPLWDSWTADLRTKGLPAQEVLDEGLSLVEKYRP